mmetsp:Transcript_15758/g.23731  ORF Transcript_15758/g.23731 Transcript_15758/m.23731 type:complete len:808 (-) Transcript_15758:59-2482(-)|eukprot:CAMPEP_0167748094 /NCGR_PEP_ID=MMETSP0110_2-20121227/4650_1 /TAXON_ID=629695 /ORGANISM="Gymnochlora sp., Strain CCMP2014" /LENGTH=807 /DNA_ID=CAMNT_0007633077 /DNA_START=527 /DNA_END=2947 /DNA_ORIENTATION=-
MPSKSPKKADVKKEVTTIPENLKIFAEGKDFRVEAYIEEILKKPEALVDPQSALLEHCSELRGSKIILHDRLIDLLNSNYKDFIGLPAKLEGTSEFVADVSRELDAIRSQIATVAESTKDVVDRFKSTFERRTVILKRREVLETLQLAHGAHKKLVLLLEQAAHPLSFGSGKEKKETKNSLLNQYRAKIEANQVEKCEVKQTDGLATSATALERAANQLIRLRVSVAKVTNFQLIESLKKDIPALESKFSKLACQKLIQAVRTSALEQVNQLLCALTFADMIPDAEEVLREQLVQPTIDSLLTSKTLLRVIENAASLNSKESQTIESIPKSPSDCNTLYQLIELTINRVSKTCEPVLKVARFPLNGFGIVSRVIAPEIFRSLRIHGGSKLFATYPPHAFLAHYKASRRMIKVLSDLCPSDKHRAVLRDSPDLSTFETRWSLNVYFQLRFQDLRKPVDKVTSLAPKVLMPSKNSKNKYALTATHVTWEAVLQCWSPEIWLAPLTHRFFKATVQILRAYSVWVTEGIDSLMSKATSKVDSKRMVNDKIKRKINEEDDDVDIKSEKVWSESVPTLLKIEADITALCSGVQNGELFKVALQRLVEASPSAQQQECRHLLIEGFSDVLGELRGARQQCVDLVVAKVAHQCCKGLLAGTPRIKLKYSMTGNAPPTSPSSFVAEIFTPLKDFAVIYAEIPSVKSQIESEVKDSATDTSSASLWLIEMVGERIAEQYYTAISDLLAVVKRTEAILTRFNKNKRTSSKMSDADKIRLQLRLDVNQFSTNFNGILPNSKATSTAHIALEKLMSLVKA